MTDKQQRHRATPEQWETLEHYVIPVPNPSIASRISTCILELRDRIKSLEAGQTCPHILSSDEGTSYCALAEQTHSKPTPNDRQIRSSAPADSLVERVRSVVASADSASARAAIREVADWLRSESEAHLGSGLFWSRQLEQEAQG